MGRAAEGRRAWPWLAAAALIALAFVGCSGGSDAATDTPSSSPTATASPTPTAAPELTGTEAQVIATNFWLKRVSDQTTDPSIHIDSATCKKGERNAAGGYWVAACTFDKTQTFPNGTSLSFSALDQLVKVDLHSGVATVDINP